MAEYDDIGAQLDALRQEAARLKAPGLMQQKLNPASADAFRMQQEAYRQRIADLQKRYEDAIGNPGAVTGRALGSTGTVMNAPLVPALQIDAPSILSRTPAPNKWFDKINDADLGMPAPAGALPPAPSLVKPARSPVGPLATAAPPEPVAAKPAQAEGDAYPGGTNTVERVGAPPPPPPPAPAAAPTPAAPPEKGLRDQFVARISNMAGRTEPGLSPEQKGRALMEAGLAIMAAASKPGATALGAIGQGGMQGTAVAREMERINRERSDKVRAEDQANLGTEFALAGKDEDRADRKEDRADRKADKAEASKIRELDVAERAADRKENAAINARKIDLLERQLEAGRTKVIESDGRYALLNTVTGAVTPTKAKVKPAKDDTPAEVRLLQALRKDPDLLETYKEIKGEKGGISDKDVIAQAVELTKAQMQVGNEDLDVVLQRNIDAVKRAAGRPGAGLSRDAQAAAIREQFRQKQITKEQAVQQLQKLGYK